jgi:hypothetical protein
LVARVIGVASEGVWVPETRSGAGSSAWGVRVGRWDGRAGAARSAYSRWGGRCRGGSGCVAVLIDESATRGVSSDWLAGSMLDDRAVVGCTLVEGPVRPMRVVVLDVVA